METKHLLYMVCGCVCELCVIIATRLWKIPKIMDY